MKHRTSNQARTQEPTEPTEPLTHLSVRELMQMLSRCADELREHQLDDTPAGTSETADRRATLHREAQIVRELRRRRHFRSAPRDERRPSAAWPPPPW